MEESYKTSKLTNKLHIDANQVKSEFDLKKFADQFCKIKHISQIIHRMELKFYRKILDTLNYIMVNVQVKLSLETYFFRG
jgi:hypothetical protein